MRAYVSYWQPLTKNRNGNGFGNLISHLMISPSCVVTWPRRMPVKWLSSSWDERTFPTLNISLLTLKKEEEKSWPYILLSTWSLKKLLPEHEPKEAVPTGHHCLFREDDRGRSSVQWKNSVMHMKMWSIWRVSGVGTFVLQKRTSRPLKSTLRGECFAINGLRHHEVSFNYVMSQFVNLFGRDNFAKTIPAMLA